jgi:dienelactone hydrolase
MLVKKPWWALRLVAGALSFSYHCREAVVKPRIDSFFRSLRGASSLKIGVAGFCFGGRYTILLCGTAFPPKDDGTPLVDCGFTAHPSLVAVPGDVVAVCRPLSVANGDDDLWLGRSKMQTLQKILEEKHAGHEVVVLEGAVHGFAVRGDPRDPRQAELGLQAEDQAVAWFRSQFAP